MKQQQKPWTFTQIEGALQATQEQTLPQRDQTDRPKQKRQAKQRPIPSVKMPTKQQFRLKHQQEIDRKTRIRPQQQKEFTNLSNWGQVYKWHQITTPWLSDSQIRQMMIFYHIRAKSFKDEGTLSPDQQYMIQSP